MVMSGDVADPAILSLEFPNMSDKQQDREEPSANHAESAETPASVDRRGGDRRQGERRKRNIPVAFDRRGGGERRQGGERRRQIDPTTCERDYSEDEIEFMRAMDRYKRDNRRPFPTWSEVLEVLFALGYRKVAEPTALPGLQPSSPSSQS